MTRASAAEILVILDKGAREFIFPMLDNGYVYLAASRLSLFASADDWALVFEVFGFSPRAGVPDLFVTAFTSQPVRQKTSADFVSEEAWQARLRLHANVEQSIFFPISDDGWIDQEDGEVVAADALSLVLRGIPVRLPRPWTYRAAGIVYDKLRRPMVFELARALAFLYRDVVLATEAERRTNLVEDLELLLVLDDWHHPDVVDPLALPSRSETFCQLAEVLSRRDVTLYHPNEPPNTHWSNWPEGGTL